MQRCQQLAGLPITTPSAELLGEWIRPGLNHHQRSPGGLEPKGESKTLLQWANAVYAALVEPGAEQQRELLNRAQEVVQEKLQAQLEQLQESGPQVLLVGALAGAAGELAMRLQHFRPEWALVEKPIGLQPKPEAMRLPALPGWGREDLRVLSSSMGLHADGWLETPCRLVIQLLAKDDSVQKLRMKLFLPERSGIQESTTILVSVNEIKQPSPVLSTGEKEIYLERFKRNHEYMTLGPSTDDPFDCKPGMGRRRLMAVLLDLSHVHTQESAPPAIAV